MLESVDWTDLGSVVERRVGSSPTARTKATAGLLAVAFICVSGGMHEMRPYKKLTIVCAIISLFSLALCLVLHYWVACEEAEFWINVCLALFGSAILTMLSWFFTFPLMVRAFVAHTIAHGFWNSYPRRTPHPPHR